MAYSPAEQRGLGGKWTAGSSGVSPAALAQAQQAAAQRAATASRMKGLTPAQRQYLQIIASARVIQARHDRQALAASKRAATARKRAAAAKALAARRASATASSAKARNPAAAARGAAAGKAGRQGTPVKPPRSTAGRTPASQSKVLANLAQYLAHP
jgi:hypothetical protein